MKHCQMSLDCQVKRSSMFLLDFLFQRHHHLKPKITTCIANQHTSKDISWLQIKVQIRQSIGQTIIQRLDSISFPSKGRRNWRWWQKWRLTSFATRTLQVLCVFHVSNYACFPRNCLHILTDHLKKRKLAKEINYLTGKKNRVCKALPRAL